MPRLLKRRTPPRPRRRQRLSLLRGESSNPDSPSVTTPSHPLSSHRPAFFVLSHLLSSPCFVSTFFSTFFSTCHPSRMLATFASPQFRWSESYVLVSLVRHFSKTSADCSRLLGPSRSRLTALPHLYPCPPYPTPLPTLYPPSTQPVPHPLPIPYPVPTPSPPSTHHLPTVYPTPHPTPYPTPYPPPHPPQGGHRGASISRVCCARHDCRCGGAPSTAAEARLHCRVPCRRARSDPKLQLADASSAQTVRRGCTRGGGG